MTIPLRDVELALERVVAQATKHTELVMVTYPVSEAKPQVRSLASGLLLWPSIPSLLVTCNHVTRKGKVHYFGPGRLHQDRVPEGPRTHVVAPAALVAENRDFDLALLRGDISQPSPSDRIPYDITRSDIVTSSWLAERKSCAAFILGYWGARTKCASWDDGQFYVETFLYGGCGPLVQVESGELLADMSEDAIVFRNPRLPKRATPKVTNRRRNLKGISGSGLWMLLDDGPILVGIVLGTRQGRRDQHLIRATPIWRLRTWMGDLPLNGSLTSAQ